MNIQEQEQVEQFLKNKTFFCTTYQARISHQACLYQSARAYNRKKEADTMLVGYLTSTWKQSGDSSLKLQALLHALKGKVCLKCKRYVKPTATTLMHIANRSNKRVLFGRLSHGKNGLPRSPSIQDTLS